ncbi:transposase [Streptomyces sp900105245]|uniref:Transposase n=1 Tax=Streptomyces sp. 900105245 TaxID=3154379 RepID=A0ABV1UL27_9ACTN
MVRLRQNARPEFVPFLQFDVETRPIVCTTKTIESVNAHIRRVVRSRDHSPAENASLKCVYWVMHHDPTGTGRKRWTTGALCA